MGKPEIKRLVRIIAIIVFFMFLALFAIDLIKQVSSVRIVSYRYLVPAIVFSFASIVVNAKINDTIWKAQGIKLPPKEWFGLYTVSSFASYVVPLRGGMATMASYMKSHYSFSYSQFVSFLSASYIIIFWVNSIGAVLGLAWLWYSKSFFSLFLTVFFCASLISFTLIVFLSPKLNLRDKKWLDRFITIINDWHSTRKNLRLQVKITCLAAINLILIAITTYYEFKVLGLHISVANAIILSVIGGFSLLINITPGNLGVKEAIGALTSVALGIPAWQTVSVSILDRVVGFIIISLLTPYFASSLSIKISQERKKGESVPSI